MTIWRSVMAFLRATVRSRADEHEMQEEMARHLELAAERFHARGMSAADAMDAARREFGNVPAMQEAARDSRGARWVHDLRQDLRQAQRQFARAPFASFATVAILAAGVAGAGLAFSLTRAFLLRPLPVPEPSRLAYVLPAASRDAFATIPDLRGVNWPAASRLFSETASWDLDGFTLVGDPTPEFVGGAWVSAGYFDLTGARLLKGRFFDAAEFVPGNRVALIGADLWRRRFNGADSVIGSSIRMHSTDRPAEQEIVTIVGVMAPPAWSLNGVHDILRPLGEGRMFSLVRVPEGMGFDAAAARLTAAVRPQTARADSAWRMSLVSAQDEHVYRIRPTVNMLAGIAALLLLLAVSSAGALVLARGDERGHEISVRRALGASGGRIARQLTVELGLSWTLASAAGVALTFILAPATARAIETFGGVTVPGGAASAGPDAWVVALVLLASMLPFVALGFVPLARMLAASAGDLVPSTRMTASRSAAGARRALVVAQVALAVALVADASLLVRSIRGMAAAPLGFASENVLKSDLLLPSTRYPDSLARTRAAEGIIERVGRVPGVVGATIVHPYPFRGTFSSAIECEGCAVSASPLRASATTVVPNFFGTLSIPVVSGRPFGDGDGAGAPRVAMVSSALARALGGNREALGRRVRLTSPNNDTPWLTIVGVTGDIRKTFGDTLYPDLYVPFAQNPRAYFSVLVRTSDTPIPHIAEVRRAVAATDPALALSDVEALDAVIAARHAPQRVLASFAGGTGVLALVLAGCALYALVAWMTRRRRREFALRRALGASTATVSRLIAKEGLLLLGVGSALGLALAVSGAAVLRQQLFGVGALDVGVYIAAIALAAVITLFAIAVPLRQAARQSPAEVLRED
jgi:putative ABC transport system permease protein